MVEVKVRVSYIILLPGQELELFGHSWYYRYSRDDRYNVPVNDFLEQASEPFNAIPV